MGLKELVGEFIKEASLSKAKDLYYEEFKIGEKLSLDYDQGRLFTTVFAQHLVLDQTADLSYILGKVTAIVPDCLQGLLALPLSWENLLQHTAQELKDKAAFQAKCVGESARSVENAANLLSAVYVQYENDPQRLNRVIQTNLGRVVIIRE